MALSEPEILFKKVGMILIILLSAILLFFFLDSLTGGAIGRMVASIMFYIPFGSINTSLTQGMAAIPG